MFRKIMLSLALAGCVLLYSGCKKDSPEEVKVKSAQEHKEEAEKAIDASNMSSELDKLEKQVESETAAE